MKILIVDDSPIARRAIRDELVQGGFTLLEADSGSRALEIIASEHPNLVTLDVNMPGLDGFETCEKLMDLALDFSLATGLAYEPKVVFITSQDTFEDRVRGQNAGASDFIVKPFQKEHLLTLVHGLLHPERVYQGMTALLVDDSPLVHRITGRVLGDLGFTMRHAFDGNEALAVLDSQDEVVDLLVTDLHMPNLEGDELCRRIRADARLAATPIIVMSATAQMEDVFSLFRAGASDYVPKPFVKEVFLARVHSAMARVRPTLLGTSTLDGGELGGRLRLYRDSLRQATGMSVRSRLTQILHAAEQLQETGETEGLGWLLSSRIHQDAEILLTHLAEAAEQAEAPSVYARRA